MSHGQRQSDSDESSLEDVVDRCALQFRPRKPEENRADPNTGKHFLQPAQLARGDQSGLLRVSWHHRGQLEARPAHP